MATNRDPAAALAAAAGPAARRRREPISREAIVTAAIKLLDREGLAALSMRRLAEELGTGAASLYWHVGSKDGLLDLVFDEIIGEAAGARTRPRRTGRSSSRRWPGSSAASACATPTLVRISIGRIPMGPNALRYSERVLAILRAGGLSAAAGRPGLPAAHRHGQRLHRGRDRGGGQCPRGRTVHPDRQPAGSRGHGPRLHRLAARPSLFPNMTGLADEFALADPDERFELLIDIFIDGAGPPGRRGLISRP